MNDENFEPVFKLPDPNTFRWFCNEMFYKNQEERSFWKDKELKLDEYIRKNKWYLKKMFKEKDHGNAGRKTGTN